MSQKLFLIRRSLESYVGPMSIMDLVQAYKRLEFGLQDEVAASCGEWVTLDDVNRLKKVYPEVARAVTNDFLGGWGVSGHSNLEMIKPAKKRIASKSKSPRRKTKSNSVPFLIIFMLGMVVAFFSTKGARYLERFFDRMRAPSTAAVEEYLESGDTASFQEAMEDIMPTILPRISKSRKSYNEWIPYMRALAFQRDGAVEGLPSKLLRGIENSGAPQDCSVNNWNQIWKNSVGKWDAVVNGRIVESEIWAQILFWDPHWIQRRSHSSGWIEPMSYYEGCLMMAKKSLLGLGLSGDAAKNVEEISNRLSIIISLSRDDRPDSKSIPSSGIFSYVSCLERSVGYAGLSGCIEPEKASPEWKKYLEQIKVRIETFLLLKNKIQLTDEEIGSLKKMQNQFSKKDFITQFGYEAELSFIAATLQNSGSLREAAKRTRYDYPEVQFGD